MAKSYNNLYDSIVNYTNLDISLDKVLRGRRGNYEHSSFDLRREFNLGNLFNELESNSWVPGEPRKFRIFTTKQRDIQAPQFKDRIVHHSLNNIVEEMFTRKFIHHSYACIKGKGSQDAVRAVQKMMRGYDTKYSNAYVVQADVSKYFNNISHDILIDIFSKTIKCKDTIRLYELIIRCNGYGFVPGFGLPVGSLTSQLSANMYLNEVDQRMVNYHGFGRYVRYMDDIVILCRNKNVAKEANKILEEEIFKVGLTLNPKTEYFPIKRGIDYVGYRIYLTHILPRKRIIKNLKLTLSDLTKQYNNGIINFEYIRPKLASALGYSKHCRSNNTINKMVHEFLYNLEL